MNKKPTEVLVPVAASEVPLTIETLNKQQKHAYELALEVKASGKVFEDRWRAFCRYAYEHLLPKETTQILKLSGLPAPHVSSIKMVCGLPADEFKEYDKGEVGFKIALAKAREIKEKASGKKRKNKFAALQKAFYKLAESEPRSEKIFHWLGSVLLVLPDMAGEMEFNAGKLTVLVRVCVNETEDKGNKLKV